MTATATIYGHAVYWDEGAETYRYEDDGSPVIHERPCPLCHQPPTPEGYDACLGYIPGASSFCCGHGIEPPSIVWQRRVEWDRQLVVLAMRASVDHALGRKRP